MMVSIANDESYLGAESTRKSPLLVLVIWLLVIFTISAPGRSGLSPGSFDLLAVAKTLVRFGALLLLGYLFLKWSRRREFKKILRMAAPLICFVAWAGLSVLWSPLRTFSFGQVMGLTVLVLLTIVTAYVCRSRDSAVYLAHHLALVLFAYSLSVVLLSIFSADAAGLNRLSDEGVFHPTNIGATASLGIVFSVCLMAFSSWRWATFLTIAIPFHATAIVFANNRLSVFLAVIISCLAMLLRGNRFYATALAGCMALAGFIYVVADPSMQLVESKINQSTDFFQRGQKSSEITSFSGREEMWNAVIESYWESPIIGHGYFVTSKSGELNVWRSRRNHTAHNLVLQVLVSTGAIGTAFIAFFVFSMAVRWIKLAVILRCPSWILPTSLIMTLWYASWSVLNESFLGPLQPESVLFFVLLGMFMSIPLQPRQVDVSIEAAGLLEAIRISPAQEERWQA